MAWHWQQIFLKRPQVKNNRVSYCKPVELTWRRQVFYLLAVREVKVRSAREHRCVDGTICIQTKLHGLCTQTDTITMLNSVCYNLNCWCSFHVIVCCRRQSCDNKLCTTMLWMSHSWGVVPVGTDSSQMLQQPHAYTSLSGKIIQYTSTQTEHSQAAAGCKMFVLKYI